MHMLSRNTGIKGIRKPGVVYLKGFTIVELVLVIAIIGILASISIVSYGNWQKTIIESQLRSDLGGVAAAMENYKNFNNGYPLLIPATFSPSQYVTLTGGGSSDSKEYCIDAVSSQDLTAHYYIDQDNVKDAQIGTCAARPKKWTILSAKNGEVCGITGGIAYCWGYNSWGQLGNNLRTNSRVPVAIYSNGLFNNLAIKSISVGSLYACAIDVNNQAYCWGANSNQNLGINSVTNPILLPTAVYAGGEINGKLINNISTGSGPACVVTSEGKAYCWGYNSQGELGNNSTTNSSVPTAVYAIQGALSGKFVKSISTGDHHVCVISTDGKIFCWGYGSNGQLGDNTTTGKIIPVATDMGGYLNNKTALSISTSANTTCVLASDNNAYCWGYNGEGQLGNNSTSQSLVPTPIDTTGALNNLTIKSISVGPAHTCVVASNDKAYCWGYNSSGQLGNNTSIQSLVPVEVDMTGVLNNKTIKSIVAGNSYTCAIASDDKSYCWGDNGFGQLGNNSLISSLVPVVVSEP